jgi:hypothetical protein
MAARPTTTTAISPSRRSKTWDANITAFSVQIIVLLAAIVAVTGAGTG